MACISHQPTTGWEDLAAQRGTLFRRPLGPVQLQNGALHAGREGGRELTYVEHWTGCTTGLQGLLSRVRKRPTQPCFPGHVEPSFLQHQGRSLLHKWLCPSSNLSFNRKTLRKSAGPKVANRCQMKQDKRWGLQMSAGLFK